jgi:hypothetical protein
MRFFELDQLRMAVVRHGAGCAAGGKALLDRQGEYPGRVENLEVRHELREVGLCADGVCVDVVPAPFLADFVVLRGLPANTLTRSQNIALVRDVDHDVPIAAIAQKGHDLRDALLVHFPVEQVVAASGATVPAAELSRSCAAP